MRDAVKKNLNRNLGIAYAHTFPGHRCDAHIVGHSLETDPQKYQWDNRKRSGGWLLQYTLDGSGLFHDFEQDKTSPVPPGVAFLAPFPSPTRYWLESGTAWEFYFTIFEGDAASTHAERIRSRHGYLLPLSASGEAIATLRELHQRAGEGTLDELSVNALIHRMLLAIEAELSQPQARWPREIEAACHHLAARYGDPGLGVRELAARAGLSQHHFSRKFREATGQPPHAYLMTLRIREAMKMLMNTEIAAKDIALRTGFSDYAYFCNAFRRHTGRTPGQARRRHQELR